MKKRKWTQKEVREWFKKHHTFIYFNPNDKNIFVRKDYGVGWIMNCGNLWSYGCIIGMLAVLMIISRIL